jgi:hypothetical protein
MITYLLEAVGKPTLKVANYEKIKKITQGPDENCFSFICLNGRPWDPSLFPRRW